MSLSRNSLTPGALVLGAGGNVGFGVVGGGLRRVNRVRFTQLRAAI